MILFKYRFWENLVLSFYWNPLTFQQFKLFRLASLEIQFELVVLQVEQSFLLFRMRL